MAKKEAAKLLYGTYEKLVGFTLIALLGGLLWLTFSSTPINANTMHVMFAAAGTLTTSTLLFCLYFRKQLRELLNLND